MRNTLTRSAVVRPLVLFVTIVATSLVAVCQEQRSVSAIQLIPQPRQVVVKPGVFRLGTGRIVLANPRSEEDRFAASDFASDLQETAALAIRIGTSGSRRAILFGTLDLRAIQLALKRTGISAPANLDPEGYLLVVNANEVVVAGKTAAGAFYGLQTLKQLVRGEGASAFIPAVEIVDWPAMRWRGVSDDISR